MNGIDYLIGQHRELLGLFSRLEEVGVGEHRMRQQLLDQLADLITIHARLEEELLYPTLKRADEGLVRRQSEHHAAMGTQLSALLGMDTDDPGFPALLGTLRVEVERHVREAEELVFVKAARQIGSIRLEQLGGQLSARHEELVAERTSPRHGVEEEGAPLR